MLCRMRLRSYLLVAVVAFVITVTGSDMVARMVVSDLSLRQAFDQHLEWASLTILGILFLFAPYAAAALICAKVNEGSRTGTAATLFVLSLIALSYFYFGGFHASQQAMVDERWTAAALSIGLLPFFVGVPFVLLLIGAAVIVRKLDRQTDP
jgi:hypothetical protein